MTILINSGVFIAILIGVMIFLNLINIWQAGSKRPDGRTMKDILGMEPEKATFNDVDRLSRKDKMQLFFAAEAPDFELLNGEFEAKLLSGGVLGPATAYYTHHVFPTGGITFNTRWVGKGFKSNGDGSGAGYNIFARSSRNKPKELLRLRQMETGTGRSNIGKGGKACFQLNYSRFNAGTVHSMRDEVRQINPDLFIGAGYMSLGGGSYNPGPFVLIGPAGKWVGPDTEPDKA